MLKLTEIHHQNVYEIAEEIGWDPNLIDELLGAHTALDDDDLPADKTKRGRKKTVLLAFTACGRSFLQEVEARKIDQDLYIDWETFEALM